MLKQFAHMLADLLALTLIMAALVAFYFIGVAYL